MRLFDLHCDTTYRLLTEGGELSKNVFQVDLKRGVRFAPWVQTLAAWIPDDKRGDEAITLCDDLLKIARNEILKNADRVMLATDARSLKNAVKSGKSAMLLSVEGGAALGGRLDRVAMLKSCGVWMMTLTWNGANELGNGCFAEDRSGLTAFGKSVVDEMRRVEMIVDVSHLSERGFWDVAERGEDVFVATHSPMASVCPHPRNLTDAQFSEIVRRHGLVGMNLCKEHLGEQSFDRLYRHLDRAWSLDGETVTAFGCDFDGTDLPDEWNGIAVMEQIGDYLTGRGISASLLDRLFFQNAFDFFSRM